MITSNKKRIIHKTTTLLRLLLLLMAANHRRGVVGVVGFGWPAPPIATRILRRHWQNHGRYTFHNSNHHIHFNNRQRWGRSSFHSTTSLPLNRFMFDPTELDDDNDKYDNDDDDDDEEWSVVVPTVTLPKDDYRTLHAAKILGLHNGDTVRAGIVWDPDDTTTNTKYAGLVTDAATIQWIPQGKIKKAQPLGNGQPPGSLQISLQNLTALSGVPGEARPPPVSLILALPRPLALGRLLPMICQLGVDHIVLTHAQKVPRDYFGSHLFRQPGAMRQLLVQGLCQASVDVRLPRITIVKNLRHFLHHDLERFFPLDTHARVLAHPQRQGSTGDETKSNGMVPVTGRFEDNVQFPVQADARRVVLAVGPEGGWVEPDELELLTQTHHFQTVTLGPRVLRSDVAVVALMALANEACRTDNVKKE